MRKFNEWLASSATLVFGTMWMTYLFFAYGFMPLIFPKDMDKFMYWSGTVQLWALPLIMVGQEVQGRSAAKRAEEDHQMIMTQFTTQKEEIAELRLIIANQVKETADIKELLHDMHLVMEALQIPELQNDNEDSRL